MCGIHIILSSRLAHIAGMISADANVADIGTDHARLPIALWQNGSRGRLIATEVSDGPMDRARKMVTRCGADNRIELRKGNGLCPIAEGEADTIIIAGMGGETIAEILETARRDGRSFAGERLILQPMVGYYELRKYLSGSCFDVLEESLCLENGRARLFITVRKGEGTIYDAAGLYLGKELEKSPYFEEYRRGIEKHLRNLIKGRELRGETETLRECREVLARLFRL